MNLRNSVLKITNSFIELRREYRNKKRIEYARKLIENHTEPYRLNVGCGKNYFDGWLNIDINSNQPIDIDIDIRWPLPFDDNTCELIYSEHTLEHLTVEEGVGFLKECYRVLNRGGIVRVAMPSLDNLIQRSYEGNWRDVDWLSWPEYKHIRTRAEMMNIAFRAWGHQWLYDREELFRRFKEAGFVNTSICKWGKSKHISLCGRETRKDSLLIAEAEK